MGKKPTIAIDIRPLNTQLKTKRGIGQSTYRLVKKFLTTSLPFEPFFYTLGQEHLENILPNTKINYVQKATDIPKLLKKDCLDLIHFNDYFFPLYSPNDFINNKYSFLKTVITAYDVIPFYYENKIPNTTRIKENLFSILDHIDKIRANSKDTKRELIKLTGLNEKKIEVIYHGIEHCYFNANYPTSVIDKIKLHYKLDTDFILQVGAMEWRKNQITLLKAYKLLINEHNFPLDLVFVGGPPQEDHMKFIIDNNLKNRVKILGLIPDNHLPLIYNAATIFAYPSLYEGFGNPPLEAIACGLPVISSNQGSLPEILGDCPIYINPTDEINLANAIFDLFSNPLKRKFLSEKGLNQAKKFSWEITVQKLTELYLKLIQDN
ncbi:MAG: glycosyltransferase family 1 protein [Clostridia bacterium]|nr:glycosyltransferase family 1 protein [Clostridia bacterium]MDD4047709.1 glycosyltransferase family 1 protein [Clostridia bacterium]